MNPSAARSFVRNFLDALERFDADAVGAVLDDAVLHVEHPNALIPSGLRRDKAAMLKSLASGRTTLSAQRYTIDSLVVGEDDGQTLIAFESSWTGTLAIALKGKAAGDTMTAAFAVFLRLRNGKVTTWNNYDCFAPF